MITRTRVVVFLALSFACLGAVSLVPMFMQPQAVPVARIIANLEKQLKQKPKDATLHYTLARALYLSVVNESALIPAYGERLAPRHLARGFLTQRRYEEARTRAMKKLGFDAKKPLNREQRAKYNKERSAEYQELVDEGWVPKPLKKKALLARAQRSMALFDKAINLEPKNALFHLSRASLAEQVLQLAAKKKLDKPLPGVSPEATRDLYLQAWQLSLDKDLANNRIPIGGLEQLVSHEAGAAFLRLARETKRKWTPKEKKQVEAVRDGMAKLGKMRRGPITPIVIGTHAESRLADLLDPECTVTFDLDDDGAKDEWPWVRPDTGILVWAPMGMAVQSGHQLFGSVTFNLFHRDGYAALALLDDDGDGWLRGLELDGLAIWFDRNSDGRSTGDELLPVLAAEVASVAVTPDGFDGEAPARRGGVRYEDGRAVPTIDWIVRPR